METVQLNLAPAAPEVTDRLQVGLSTCMIQRGRSGVAQYVFALVRALAAREDAPALTLFVLEEDAPLFSQVRPQVRIVLVPEGYRSPIRNILWHQVCLPRLIRQGGLDVLHIPSYRRMLWPRPCPLVATIHDLAPFHVNTKYDPLRMLYGRRVVRRLAQRQHAIIAVSRHTADDIERFFHIKAPRVEVILNGLDHTRFHPGDPVAARAEVHRRWGVEGPYFLYVSRLEHPAKNHLRLIEAFARWRAAGGRDWQLVLGGSDWHGAETIRAAARDCPAAASIRFLGFVADEDLPVLYRGAGAFVYPSLFEGFGFPTVEAMACGCPVLSSTRGALREVVADAAGILDAEDARQMEAALARIVSDSDWREHLRAQGLRNARRFDWEDNAWRVLACYHRTAAGRGRGATLQSRRL